MSIIDRQRIEAVRLLVSQGFSFEDGSWKPPRSRTEPAPEGDALHAMMVRRVADITGCAEREIELESLSIAINAYESARWRA